MGGYKPSRGRFLCFSLTAPTTIINITCLYFVVISFCFCYGTLKPNSHDETTNTYQQTQSCPWIRYLSSNQDKTVFIVSTLDGRVQAFDVKNNGKILWSVQANSQPLLSSSISKIELSKNGVKTRLIPSLDGGLYQEDGTNIERLLISSETLLSSTFRIDDDTMMIGGKTIQNYGIDMNSGQLRYTCSLNGCQQFGYTDSLGDEEDLLVITRNTQTIRAVDSRTGSEKWNFSVGHHDVNYVGLLQNKLMKSSNTEVDEASEMDAELENNFVTCPDEMNDIVESSLKIVVPQGIIFCTCPDDPNQMLWQHKLSSPVAGAWLLHQNKLRPISLFNKKNIPTLPDSSVPLMYIGQHHDQPYVQVSDQSVEQVAPRQIFKHLPSVGWKPYVASSLSRTPALRSNTNNKPLIGRKTFKKKNPTDTAVAVWHQNYPFDDGYYIFPDFKILFDEEKKHISEDEKGVSGSYFDRWKEIILITIVLFVTIPLALSYRNNLNHSDHDQHHITSSERFPSSQEQDETKSGEELVVSKQPKEDLTRPGSLQVPSEIEYVSKYYTDFEHVEKLSHGAFGIVFVAKNKFDSCQYAVKRICLPKCASSEEKVMREVTTLASLDHAGIVRYFQSWFECPPAGWQEKMDLELGNNVCLTPSPVTQTTTPSGVTSEKPNNHIADCLDRNPLRPFNDLDFSNIFPKTNGVSGGFSSYKENDESGSFSISDTNLQSTSSKNESKQSNSSNESQNKEIPFQQYEKSDQSLSIVFQDSGCEEKGLSSYDNSTQLLFPSEKHLTVDDIKSTNQVACKKDNNNSKNKKNNSPKMYLYIQMMLCKRETLKDWLTQHTEKRNPEVVLDYFDQIVEAVDYVHKKGVLHRDLKPSNILFSKDGLIKVGDFGLATAMTNFLESEAKVTDNMKETTDTDEYVNVSYKRHTGGVGTQIYMSPELINGKDYNEKVDIFALGMILFELFYPFDTESERRKKLQDVKKRRYPDDFHTYSPESYQEETCDLLNILLSPDPAERPSAEQVLNSSLMIDFVYSKIPRRFRTRTLSNSSKEKQS
ncbi:eukaryotic translation initiation factor 2-alpha kinase 3 isoform X2 [Octopus bimaculoides]|uniref:non-specific serine/threonine protein kinase n=1 Tax=Octopus bimaculoides TaxID=37653 RepID=A0A0L8HGS0_OCTBM|nr:eukaryotic translation initiation factor 2-alpha kinase 3 isoform X2 [Octopus bimaculoides]|eukprot:XP_014772435.1 PREDICTED: eukaryotic translation initiation factor 2-alpha kinase 3-like isoform X2 [Octopus bimaculoides]